jgi:acetolactate synthase-1/2/3 large subunit
MTAPSAQTAATTAPAAAFTVVSNDTVAQLLLRYLKLEGATTLFGVPGGALMHLLNELKQQRATFRYVIGRHETGCAYMADGFARVSGKLGVVVVTSGPGATNALTGVMNAQAAGVPLLAISGEIASAYFGMGYLQEGIDAGLDVNQIYANASGYSVVISNPANAATLLEQALRDALGRPGRAAHISLPDDVAAAAVAAYRMPTAPSHYRTTATGRDAFGLQKVFEKLLAAERPLLFIGSGCAAALRGSQLAAFTEFVERFAIPVMTTPDAKALFPESHPLSLRCFGQAFCEWTKFYMAPSLLDASLPAKYDALLVLGTQLGGFATNKWDATLWPAGPVMQVDLNPDVLGRVRPLDLGVVGELGAAISALTAMGRETDADSEPVAAGVQARRAFIARIKAERSPYFSPGQRDSTATPIEPAAAMKCLSLGLPAGSEVFIDSGNCVGWALHYLEVNPPSRVHSALAMGPMGFAVGAVVGAKLAAPDAACVAIVGDGAFLMHGTEVSTAAAYGLGAIWVVLDNQDLAMVSQGMGQFFPDTTEPAVWTDYYGLGHNKLALMAQALGADAYEVASVPDLQHALGAALNAAQLNRKPQVVVVRINPQPLPPYYQPPGLPTDPLA